MTWGECDAVAGTARDRVEDITERAGNVFRGNQNRAMRNVISFATGTGVGVGVGLLLAPASGKETRRRIVEKAETIGHTVRERFSPQEKKPPRSTAQASGGAHEGAARPENFDESAGGL